MSHDADSFTDDLTPPYVPGDPPLTPPPSSPKQRSDLRRSIVEIAARRDCRRLCEEPWLYFSLDAAEFSELRRRFCGDEFYENKLRYDYFPSSQHLVLRMPTAVHERFIAQVSEEILRQLSSLASKNHPLAVLAGEIKDLRSTSIVAADTDYGRHDPDGSLARGDEAPSVVFEVLYSQKRKGLTRLVDDYILGSDGGIRAVVALDIDYHGRMAKVEMWRPCIRTQDGEQILEVESALDQPMIFREDNGQPNLNPNEGLRISHDMFAPATISADPNDLIFISAETLCVYLREAERYAENAKRRRDAFKTVSSTLKKRRRESPPPEELDSESEDMFSKEEERTAKRADRNDKSYRGSSNPPSKKSYDC